VKTEEDGAKGTASPNPEQGKPATNGDTMAVDEDEDEEDAFLRKAMGYATPRPPSTTQPASCPGSTGISVLSRTAAPASTGTAYGSAPHSAGDGPSTGCRDGS